jgi:sodium transport system permease protein
VRTAAVVLGCELRRLLRDRRALVAAVVLPMLLYPLVFLGGDELQRVSERSLEEREVFLLADVRALGGDEREAATAALDAIVAEGRTRVQRGNAPTVLTRPDDPGDPEAAERAARELLERRGLDALLVAARGDGGSRLVLWYDGSDPSGGLARQRVGEAVADQRATLVADRLERALGADPAGGLPPETVDVAAARDRGGAALGRILPLLAVLAVLSGASMAALDSFAGERERGTLETLLVQPAPASGIAWGKFGAVLVTGVVALVGNVASLTACAALGLGSLPGAGAEGLAVGGARLALGALLFLPTVVQLSAALSLVCARASSFREGQHYVFPLTLVVVIPAAVALTPTVELDYAWALVPISGPALALRDALSGQLALGPVAVLCAATLFWTAVALRGVSRTLDAERVLGADEGDADRAARHTASRRAVAWGAASAGLIVFAGGWLQSIDPLGGLAATLWGLVLGLALLAAAHVRRASGATPAESLGLRAPSARALLAAPLLVPVAVGAALLLQGLLEGVLPLPRAAQEADVLAALEGLSLPVLLLLIAVSPAICEELLFRGAVLDGLRRDRAPARAVLLQAALFALAHASVHRLAPTFLLGVLLGTVTLRARSVLPAMLLHALYNGTLVVIAWREVEVPAGTLALVGLAPAALAGLLLARPRRSR